jgi:hypothetical protein
MSILREWRAEIRRPKKAEYVEYVRTTGIAGYRDTPGNRGAVVAVRDLGHGVSSYEAEHGTSLRIIGPLILVHFRASRRFVESRP